MTIAYVKFGSGAYAPAPFSYNEFYGAGTYDTVGVLSSDLKDDSNVSTGWGLEVVSVFGTAGGSGSWAASGAGGWDEKVFDTAWLTTNGGTGSLKITGLPVGHTYSIFIAGHNFNGRDTDFTVGGSTSEYDSTTTTTPLAPIEFTGTVGGSGEITISITKAVIDGQFYGYVNGMSIETTPPASRSITNIDTDNNVQAGQSSVTVTTVGLDASPTTKTATLGGESLTVISAGETSWTVDIPLHINLEWGSTTNALVLTDDTGSVTLNNVTLSAPTGWETVTFTSAPDAGTTESFYEYAQTDADVGNFTAAVNDILAFESQSGLTVDSQTIPTVSPPATVTGDYKWWDVSLSTWTNVSSFTITDGGIFGSASQLVLHDILKPVLKSPLKSIFED